MNYPLIGGLLFGFSLVFPFILMTWYVPTMMNSKRGESEGILYLALAFAALDVVMMITGVLMLPRV